VVGTNNSLAYEAAKRVITSLGKDYNPLFIWGGVGLGKTHLMHAVGHAIYRQRLGYKIIYRHTEEFMYEYFQMINKKEPSHNFRLKYRNADVLLLDDIQFLEGQKREFLQDELFSIFNKLKETSKQMIFTCDRPLDEISQITERLLDRFNAGLAVQIHPPDIDTRKEILTVKSKEKGLQIDPDIIHFIASNITENVRRLEAAIQRLQFMYERKGIKHITMDMVLEEKDSIIGTYTPSRKMDPDTIIRAVAGFYNISEHDLLSRKKNHAISKPRQMAFYLIKKLTHLSTSQIGKQMGGRSHSTVIVSVDKMEKEIDANRSTRDDYEQLINSLMK